MPERLITCPDCGNELSVSAELKGHAAVRCPSCGGPVSLPADLRPPPPPPLARFAPEPITPIPTLPHQGGGGGMKRPPVPEAVPVDEEEDPPEPRRKKPGEPPTEGDSLAGFRVRELTRDLLVLDEEVNPLKLILFAGAAFFALVLSIAVVVFLVSGFDNFAASRPGKLVKAVVGAGFLVVIAAGILWAFFYTLWEMAKSFRFDRLEGEAVFTRLYGLRRLSCPLKRIQAVSLSRAPDEKDRRLDEITLTLLSPKHRPIWKVAELYLDDRQTPELVGLAELLSRALGVPLKIDAELRHGPKRLRRALERADKQPPAAPTPVTSVDRATSTDATRPSR